MLYGRFPKITIFSLHNLFSSKVKISELFTLILFLYFSDNLIDKFLSYSTTQTFIGFLFKISLVKYPVPGPTSKT